MSAMASGITSVSVVFSSVWSGADQRKHQSSASLAFVSGNHRSAMDYPHKGSVMRKLFPFGDVVIKIDLTKVTLRCRFRNHGKGPFDKAVVKVLSYHSMQSINFATICLLANRMCVVVSYSYGMPKIVAWLHLLSFMQQRHTCLQNVDYYLINLL